MKRYRCSMRHNRCGQHFECSSAIGRSIDLYLVADSPDRSVGEEKKSIGDSGVILVHPSDFTCSFDAGIDACISTIGAAIGAAIGAVTQYCVYSS